MPEEREPYYDAAQRRMRFGQHIGRLARGLFPNGELVAQDNGNPQTSAEQTMALIASGADVIFEATFAHGDLYVRCDILKREAGGWHLIEVKSSTSYHKSKHLPDVAFQAHVLKECGINVTATSLMLLNRNYRWDGGEWDLTELFRTEDLSSDVDQELVNVAERAASFVDMMSRTEYPPVDGVEPYVDPVIHAPCNECEFKKHCSQRVPSDHVHFLGLHHSKTKKLLGQGIASIHQVPPDLVMTDVEALRYRSYVAGVPVASDSLREELERIRYPALLIDFETLRPGLPLFAGHGPYQHLPFQWSCHTLDAPPTLSSRAVEQHREFLHGDRSDPRAAFVAALLELFGSGGSILHYHGFEVNVIKQMEADGIPGAKDLVAMLPRFVDLLEIVRTSYADARFLGKTSIKNVLPVVAPHLSYEGLAIQNGDQAQAEYERLLCGDLSPAEASQIRAALLAYCKLDTWAMVEVLSALYRAIPARTLQAALF